MWLARGSGVESRERCLFTCHDSLKWQNRTERLDR